MKCSKNKTSRVKILFTFCTLLFSLVSLSACGGGNSSDEGSSGTPTVKKGQFILVAGLHFETPTQSGITNVTGDFRYIEGETVTFSIGDIQFPQVLAEEFVTPFHMARTYDRKNQMVINIKRLLQTLDEDESLLNAIAISADAANAASGQSIDFSQNDALFEAAVAPFLTAIPGQRALISKDSVVVIAIASHLIGHKVGSYSGTFSGDLLGTLELTIDPSGGITGIMVDDSNEVIATLSGSVRVDGLMGAGDGGGRHINIRGNLTFEGDLSGDWFTTTTAATSGTFSVKKK